jgi:SAM-dependent methyltransferase
MAHFALNTGDGRRAFRALYRILRPGGLLFVQEWGALDKVSAAFEDILAIYTADVSAALPDAVRTYTETPRPWYAQVQDAPDCRELLREAGFRLAWAQEATFATVPFASPSAYIAYKLAWPNRGLLVDALDPAARMACLAALEAAVTQFVQSDGQLGWRPPLLRACAVR